METTTIGYFTALWLAGGMAVLWWRLACSDIALALRLHVWVIEPKDV